MPANSHALRQPGRLLLPTLLCGLLAGVPGAAAAEPPSDQRLTVRVDSRVELLCIIYRLAEFNEYAQGRIESYADDVDRHFEPFKDHTAVKWMKKMRSENGVGFDSAIAIAIHMTNDGTWRPLSPLANPELQLYNRDKWSAATATTAINLVRDFAEDSDFASFQAAHRDMYDLAEERMRAVLERECNLDWFEEFFGVPPKAPFTLCLGLLNGGANYGPKYRGADGTEHLYAIMGAWMTDEEGRPDFDESVVPTVIHEFNHSFVNHLVDAHVDDLEAAGRAMYPPVAARMRRQAYGNWHTMFYESLVRACVVRYVLAERGIEAAAEVVQEEEIQRSFIWTGELSAVLHEYELDRTRYPTLESFMPRVVAYFNDLGPRIDAVHADFVERYEASRPVVVATTPADLSRPVDPSTTSLTFVFSRPMGPWYTIMVDPDAGDEQCPDIGEVAWDETCTVFTMEVTLEPGHHYYFTLNSKRGGSFKSKEGIPLASFPVSFDTRE